MKDILASEIRLRLQVAGGGLEITSSLATCSAATNTTPPVRCSDGDSLAVAVPRDVRHRCASYGNAIGRHDGRCRVESWIEFWWLLPVALAICVLVRLVGVEGSLLFAPFYAVVFPWLSGRALTPLQAIQIGIISEIFGFSSSFVGFYRARLIDFRLGLRTAAVGAPLALAGVFLAYRVPQPVLLVVVALALPALAWYLRRPLEVAADGDVRRQSPEEVASGERVRAAAVHVPLCCYSSGALYTNAGSGDDAMGVTVTTRHRPPRVHAARTPGRQETGTREHVRDSARRPILDMRLCG